MTQSRLGAPWFAMVALMVVGLIVVLAGSVRTGGAIMALALALGGGLRAALPTRYVPDLAVRSRTADVGGYVLLAVVTFAVFSGVKLPG